MRPRLVRSGLAIPAVCAQVAAMAAVLASGAAPIAAALALIVAIGLGVAAARRRGDRRWVLAAASAAAVAAVLVAVAVAEPRRHPPGLPIGHVVTATVRIESVGAVAGNDHAGSLVQRGVLTGVLTEVRAGSATVAVDAPVRLFLDRAPRRLVPGSVVSVTTVLRSAAATDAVAYLGGVTGGTRVVRAAPPVEAAADALRARFVVQASRLPGDGAALLPGLAIGDVRSVPDDLTQAMRNASLSHLTAVSGANCAVVIAGVLALGGLLRLPRLVRLLAAGAALAGFVVLVTPQPSVVRAAVMAAIVLARLARGHPARGLPVLAVAVLALLVSDPWYAWSVGFVLSVLATGGLLLLTEPIADRIGRLLPRPVALLVAVPIAAQLACQPVLVLLQPTVPLGGVLANLFAEPAAPVATVLGLLACLLGPVVPPIAGGLTVLAWLPAAWIALVARVASGLPQVPWPAGPGGAVLAAALVAAVLLTVVRGVPRRARAAAAGLVAASVLAAGGAAAGGVITEAVGFPHDWDLAACDVGQGDGLVLNGGGHYAVVDTGRRPQPILACLDRLGVRRIELLVLTHWDADHVGAARSLAGRTAVAFVGPSDGAAADELRRSLVAAGVRVQQPHRGDSVRIGRDLLQVLWPPDPLGPIEPGNAASITLLVSGRFTTVMEGDLGEAAQDALLAAGPLPRVDVVKVAHHGSADQSSAFYAALDARLGIISVGADNDYGHPTARLLQILRTVGTPVVRTDQDGMVLVSARDGRLSVWTEHPITAAVWQPALR